MMRLEYTCTKSGATSYIQSVKNLSDRREISWELFKAICRIARYKNGIFIVTGRSIKRDNTKDTS